MDLQQLFALFLAGGVGGLITAISLALKARSDAARDDRRQKADETTGAAGAAKTITDAASALVKLADDQVEEFKLQIRALQAESSALNTRLDLEIQKRMRAEAKIGVLEDEVIKQREALAGMGAQFELVDQERVALKRENGAMKTKLFEMSVGIQSLTRQVHEAGFEPVYVMEVPVIDPPKWAGEHSTGPLKT